MTRRLLVVPQNQTSAFHYSGTQRVVAPWSRALCKYATLIITQLLLGIPVPVDHTKFGRSFSIVFTAMLVCDIRSSVIEIPH